jgi:hypothetical protein
VGSARPRRPVTAPGRAQRRPTVAKKPAQPTAGNQSQSARGRPARPHTARTVATARLGEAVQDLLWVQHARAERDQEIHLGQLAVERLHNNGMRPLHKSKHMESNKSIETNFTMHDVAYGQDAENQRFAQNLAPGNQPPAVDWIIRLRHPGADARRPPAKQAYGNNGYGYGRPGRRRPAPSRQSSAYAPGLLPAPRKAKQVPQQSVFGPTAVGGFIISSPRAPLFSVAQAGPGCNVDRGPAHCRIRGRDVAEEDPHFAGKHAGPSGMHGAGCRMVY